MDIALHLAALKKEFENMPETKKIKNIILAIDNLQELLDNFEE